MNYVTYLRTRFKPAQLKCNTFRVVILNITICLLIIIFFSSKKSYLYSYLIYKTEVIFIKRLNRKEFWNMMKIKLWKKEYKFRDFFKFLFAKI